MNTNNQKNQVLELFFPAMRLVWNNIDAHEWNNKNVGRVCFDAEDEAEKLSQIDFEKFSISPGWQKAFWQFRENLNDYLLGVGRDSKEKIVDEFMLLL